MIRESALRGRQKRGPYGAAFHLYDDLSQVLHDMEDQYPEIAKVFSAGKSVQGRELWGIEITRNPGVKEMEPEMKYIGNIHGDEVIGRENLIRFVQYLCTQYGKTDLEGRRVTKLIDSTALYIIPSMNPDGFEAQQRTNMRGVDLNRDFPDQYRAPNKANFQPETAAIMNFSSQHNFIVSVNFHGGAVVVNYPYDGTTESVWGGLYSAAPDDELFIAISHAYADLHPTMRTEFPTGITNGAEWYVLYGGMQDWNYVYKGTFELTIELGPKTPLDTQLEGYYEDNLESMLYYLEVGHTGVRGVVRKNGQPVAATINIAGIDHPMQNDPVNGDYYRPLIEGNYVIKAKVGDQEQAKFVYIPQLGPYSFTTVNFNF